MKDHCGDERERVRRHRLAGGLCAAGVALTLVSAAVAVAASGLGPVPRKVLAVVNANGKQYSRAHHVRTRVMSQRAAVHGALSSAPWRGCATGISLMRTTKQSEPSAPGSLIWLVSVHPNRRGWGAGGGAGPPPRGPPAKYFLLGVRGHN